MERNCIHDYYINCPQFEIHQTGNDFDVLAQPVAINAIDSKGVKRRLLCIDYFNLAPLKEAIDTFESERCKHLIKKVG